jgi:hypothetical protein
MGHVHRHGHGVSRAEHRGHRGGTARPHRRRGAGAVGYFGFIRWLRSDDIVTRALALLAMSFTPWLADVIWGTDPKGIPDISTSCGARRWA